MDQKYLEVCKILREMMGNVSVAINGYESPARKISTKKIKRPLKKKI